MDTGTAKPGEAVRIVGPGGRLLGRALYSSTSQIALRIVSFDDTEIDENYWRSRLIEAERLRESCFEGESTLRLVYGESDLLPSLIVDRYQDCFTLQTLSQGMEALKEMWVALLVELYRPRAVIERNDARVREMEGLPRSAKLLYGSDPGEIVIDETGVKFSVNLLKGQKTGWFLDQKENRITAGRYAAGRALDCFSYEGGFALHLARGAKTVKAIDVSGPAIERARRNASLNGIANIEFVEANVFDVLSEMERTGERFDTIVLDPPAFAKSRTSVEAARRGYKEINLRAMKMLNSGGILISSTCSYHMSEDTFLNLLSEAAADAHRSARIVERRTQSRDHPVLISMPETHYLKCVILSVR